MKDKRCSILWSPCHQLTETNPYYKKEKEYDPFLSSVFGLFIYLFTIYIFLDIFIFNRLHVCLLFIRFDFFIRVDFIGFFVVRWEPTAKTGSQQSVTESSSTSKIFYDESDILFHLFSRDTLVYSSIIAVVGGSNFQVASYLVRFE